jgi:hypothetical protein
MKLQVEFYDDYIIHFTKDKGVVEATVGFEEKKFRGRSKASVFRRVKNYINKR